MPGYHGVDALLLCGDLTGKSLVPIIDQGNDTHRAFYFGKNWSLTSGTEVDEMEQRINDAGAYALRCDRDRVAELQGDPRRSIFNLHAPPHGTMLDLAPELDASKKPVTIAGQVNFEHVGSKAVTEAIERYQPLMGLHGHIHESCGHDSIGDTPVINPGSEYGEGILRGYVIEIENGLVVNQWKVEG